MTIYIIAAVTLVLAFGGTLSAIWHSISTYLRRRETQAWLEGYEAGSQEALTHGNQ